MKLSLRIWHRLLILSLACIVPFTGLVFYLISSGFDKDINFARQEMLGNQYQVPLEKILEIAGDWEVAQQAGGAAGSADILTAALKDLDRVQAEHGETLQFTPAGLAQRKRAGADPAGLRAAWEKVFRLTGKEASDQARATSSMARTMITHAGDTSNLILDPDLDSYYLMDVTLLALPQMQDRLMLILLFLQEGFRSGSWDAATLRQLAVHRTMLEESDLLRIEADAQTVLAEDANFYGALDAMQAGLPTGTRRLGEDVRRFIDLLRRLEESPASVSQPEVLQAGTAARKSSFVFWNTSVAFLDQLLQARIAAYTSKKQNSLLMVLALVLVTSIVATGVTITITHPLKRVAKTLGDASDAVLSSAGGMDTASRELSDAANSQSASLEQTGAAVEELSSMTRRNADHAAQSNLKATTTRDISEKCATELTSLHVAMTQMEQIIKSIDEIAFQTNILALNAAVEAARAGEAGAGFAVVANEVRNLAERSATAAHETSEKIQQGASLSSRVREHLSVLVEQFKEVDSLVNDIAVASKEQAAGIDQINSAIQQMNQATQAGASNAQRTADAAQDLNNWAETLDNNVRSLSAMV